MGRAVARARLHDDARAVAEATAIIGGDRRANGPPIPADFFYDAAVIHALASIAALKEDARPRLEREETAERHAADTVALLLKAQQSHYFQAPSALKDPAFDSLRARADFRLLVMDLAFPADPFAR
jgi:hypothetical protein